MENGHGSKKDCFVKYFEMKYFSSFPPGGGGWGVFECHKFLKGFNFEMGFPIPPPVPPPPPFCPSTRGWKRDELAL